MNIALILPSKADYLANTVLDGFIDLQSEKPDLNFIVTENYPSPLDLKKYEKNEDDFLQYCRSVDLIILIWGKNSTNFSLVEKINKWQKTVFVDGSELGKNNRFDPAIRQAVIDGTYNGIGAIDQNMLNKCKLYFRREKPYIKSIIPFPFGIERRYRKFFTIGSKRNIDFTCIFGQDQYPMLRKEARDYLEFFSKKKGFTSITKRTKGFNFDDNSKKAGRDEFYEILSKSKVGISIGGGGFDTARFWEILASGAVLLTEKVDIYNENDNKLNYERIIQFDNFDDFKIKVEELSHQLEEYENDHGEYLKIISEHSTKARVKELIANFQKL